MSADDLARADALFDAALDLDAAHRVTYLDRECPDDPTLRARVERLLQFADAETRERTRADTRAGPFWGGWLTHLGSGSVPAWSPTDDDETATVDARGGKTGFEGGFAQAVAKEPQPGDVLGELEIEERLATGGMGTVFRARHGSTGEVVALKVLARHRVADPTARGRFLAEAQAASAFDHPALCQVFDAGEDDTGRLYLAMAYYAGETLARRIARGPLSVSEAVDIASRLADGLHHAHGAGVVHRDVKPSNILLPETGGVKLLDFGIAKLEAATALTRPGFLVGTVAYVSPEQARGETVDPRTDLWSLGVVLFEMLTGEKPFDEPSPPATLKAIVRQAAPRLRPWRPDAPDVLQVLLDRVLAKERDARPDSGEALARALRALGR
ncbi:MAG: serine/threonine-protein kinase [Acidobacteriota bacterium]